MIAHSSERDDWENLLENDDVFDALSDGQRRQLLVDLLDSDPQHVAELSDASRELVEARVTFLDQFLSGQLEIPGADRERIREHHVHLPKLAEYGFIEWHSEDDFVTKGPRFDEIKPFLELIQSHRTDRTATDPFLGFSE